MHRRGLIAAAAIAAAVATAIPVTPAFSATSLTVGSAAATGAHHHRHRHTPRPIPAVVACADVSLAPSPGDLGQVASATLCMVNNLRALAGVQPLRSNASLTAAATGHSQDMVAGHYVGEVSPTGSSLLGRLEVTGYLTGGAGAGEFSIGENDSAAGSPASASETVAGWASSPTALANILNPVFRDTGIGVVAAAPAVVGRAPGVTYTEDFGRSSS
jgi:uncharacterized protein YkwD